MVPNSNDNPQDGRAKRPNAHPEAIDCIALAWARSSVYRLISDAFMAPDGELSAKVAGGEYAGRLKSSLSEIAQAAFAGEGFTAAAGGRALDRCARIAAELETAYAGRCEPQSLADEYAYLFGNAVELPLCETFYSAAQVFQQTHELSDISGFYRAFGLAVAESAHERLDHIAIELEFMHFLSLKEAYANERHGPEEVEICRAAQGKFLGDHLGRWAGAFSRLVQKKAGASFYGRAAGLLESFLNLELLLFAAEPDLLGGPAQQLGAEAPGGRCFTCGPDG